MPSPRSFRVVYNVSAIVIPGVIRVRQRPSAVQTLFAAPDTGQPRRTETAVVGPSQRPRAIIVPAEPSARACTLSESMWRPVATKTTNCSYMSMTRPCGTSRPFGRSNKSIEPRAVIGARGAAPSPTGRRPRVSSWPNSSIGGCPPPIASILISRAAARQPHAGAWIARAAGLTRPAAPRPPQAARGRCQAATMSRALPIPGLSG